MQKSQAGPGAAQLCTFSVAAGNSTRDGGWDYSDMAYYTILFEITLPNGKTESRFLDMTSSVDASKWKPPNRFKRIPSGRAPPNPLALWLSESVGGNLNKVCIVARPDGKGPWELRLFDAGHHRHLFSSSVSASHQRIRSGSLQSS